MNDELLVYESNNSSYNVLLFKLCCRKNCPLPNKNAHEFIALFNWLSDSYCDVVACDVLSCFVNCCFDVVDDELHCHHLIFLVIGETDIDVLIDECKLALRHFRTLVRCLKLFLDIYVVCVPEK